MREDSQEQLERMFPQGFLILYATDDGKNVRMLLSAEKETEAAKDLSQAFVNVKNGEWKKRS
jgi:hypothetical protein